MPETLAVLNSLLAVAQNKVSNVSKCINFEPTYFLVHLNAMSICKTTPVLKMQKYCFLVLVGHISSILEGEYG